MARDNITYVPNHVAIIMDGNGRWAAQRGLPRIDGHRAGGRNIRQVVNGLAQYNVKYLTLYGFSTENWERPQSEIRGLLRILAEAVEQEAKKFHEENVRLRHLGKLDGLPRKLQQQIRWAIELTKDNTRMTLSIAFGYGSRDEILEAVRRIVKEGITPQAIDETLFDDRLYTTGLPNPDLLIRTGGELRLSNFLLWQSAYSELYFTPVLWPDFGREEIEKTLTAYSQRQRRFGRLPNRE